ncbi:LLM class flavin-dependent oxidoreductase [Bradyrhizobium zhanjiangense]|uniref:LLM class flavin-dependent oxidoreductase n=1 Tax=Bradyrhizobium zhanjiangense TaxID=1325107 RepID=UPI0010090365|nr:LLM class flavin-dependent oxidoreductase [Bradyrhizobium zhanjiangense]
MQAKMHIGYISEVVGSSTSGWRIPGANSRAEKFELVAHNVLTAERGKLDFVFLADSVYSGADREPEAVARLEPLTLLGALSAVTERIGLVATVSTTYSEPYNLARMLASLDHISNGRIGWNIVTSGFHPEAAANFSANKHLQHAERYALAEEYLKVVKGLWDSWEDDALVADPQSGVFMDPSKMHTLNHVGQYFSVKGPLNASRPPQGYPVIFQAGASDRGVEFAGATADAVFAHGQTQEDAVALSNKLRACAEAAGRPRDSIKLMLGISVIVADTEREAYELVAQLGAMADPHASMRLLSDRLGTDMSQYELDGPVPELPLSTRSAGTQQALQSLARRRKMTIRQLRDIVNMGKGHRPVVGTAEQVADDLEAWFKSGACDGFALIFPFSPRLIENFVDKVVPILRSRGLFREDYEGRTLRDYLGVERPPHFAK